MKKAAHDAGFTLIEALVAITILSFVAMAGYSGLDSLTATLKRTEEESAKWRDVAMFFDHVEKGVTASSPAPGHPGGGSTPDAAGSGGGENAGFSFIRLGSQYRVNGQLSASRLVGYRLRDGKVEMLLRPATAYAEAEYIRSFPVIHGARSLWTRYLGADGWSEIWREPGKPRAMEIRLVLSSGEEIRRVMKVR